MLFMYTYKSQELGIKNVIQNNYKMRKNIEKLRRDRCPI